MLKILKSTKVRVLATGVIVAALLMSFSPISVSFDTPKALRPLTIGDGKLVLTIGQPNEAMAAGEIDYAVDGTDDNVQFTQAIAVLNGVGGGEILALSGNYSWAAATTVNVPANITIKGNGASTAFTGNGVTPIFTATGNNVTFKDLRTDAGGISMGATTGWFWSNLTVGNTYYELLAPKLLSIASSSNMTIWDGITSGNPEIDFSAWSALRAAEVKGYIGVKDGTFNPYVVLGAKGAQYPNMRLQVDNSTAHIGFNIGATLNSAVTVQNNAGNAFVGINGANSQNGTDATESANITMSSTGLNISLGKGYFYVAPHMGIGSFAYSNTGLWYEETYSNIAESKFGLVGVLRLSETSAANANALTGVQGSVNINATNNKNWTALIGQTGVKSTVSTVAGGTGNITGQANFYGTSTIDGSAVTNRYGTYIADATGGSVLGNQYGLYVANMTKGSTLNYALKTNGGRIGLVGLPVYANNAAAVAGGLVAGDLYRTNADPDAVNVVH